MSERERAARGRGFRHHHSDEELRRYRALSVAQKLAWLHAAWKLTVDFLPEKSRRAYEKLRRGEI
jgi:hypothetical protein